MISASFLVFMRIQEVRSFSTCFVKTRYLKNSGILIQRQNATWILSHLYIFGVLYIFIERENRIILLFFLFIHYTWQSFHSELVLHALNCPFNRSYLPHLPYSFIYQDICITYCILYCIFSLSMTILFRCFHLFVIFTC